MTFLWGGPCTGVELDGLTNGWMNGYASTVPCDYYNFVPRVNVSRFTIARRYHRIIFTFTGNSDKDFAISFNEDQSDWHTNRMIETE